MVLRTPPAAVVTFGGPGVYPVRCTPRSALGMVRTVMGDADMNELAAQTASADAAARS
jgi:hypothetical protein